MTEEEERSYLDLILQQLEWALREINSETKRFSKEFREEQRYLYDQRSGMDEADLVSAGQSHKRFAFQGQVGIEARRKITKLSESPYFGRIDFTREGAIGSLPKRLPIYIGVHSFIPQDSSAYPIYDWRAPVSSMFYDFELGEAWYQTPAGKVNGRIELRRQYRIRQGRMEYMIENSVNIQDDVLQKELSLSSDDKMKNIVATIQRDQNAIIRNETSPVLIIQGVAGSGKTSIAIHRIAFLLYRFKDEIRSSDILIISPNKVFADYISNVLPELGEANIPEIGMEELAGDLLDNRFRFQTFLQQVFTTINAQDPSFLERLQFKSTADFVRDLNRYFVHLENHWFSAATIQVGRVTVPAAFVQEKFRALQRLPLLNRMPEVASEVQQYVRTALGRKLSGAEKSQIREALVGASERATVLELYRGFYQWLHRDDLFEMPGNVLEYADVFPLIYCKIRLEGMEPYHHVKHLVVDEMQDYTPIQYAVLLRLFPAKKTILGDTSQAVNLYSSSATDIEKVFPQADIVKLHQSYRSTWEITHFALHIKANPELIAMERHGLVPEVKGFHTTDEEDEELRRLVEQFSHSNHQMLAILCKTPTQAKKVHSLLEGSNVYLLTEESTHFKEGVVIATIPLAKGLEFDEVIVPFASAEHYQSESDRNLLYVACTRAMHELTVTFTGEASGFLKEGPS
ncbi:3'-5' exonuclease [uncultured Imperialibacter sp.]|uniref:HelD family protein n=1 Tax=uncultured Imperialibacter sp. TaxID=1672639 RepID=UPI0030DD2CEA